MTFKTTTEKEVVVEPAVEEDNAENDESETEKDAKDTEEPVVEEEDTASATNADDP